MSKPIPDDVKALVATLVSFTATSQASGLARYARTSVEAADPAADDKTTSEMMYDLAARWGCGLEQTAERFPKAEAALERYSRSARLPMAATLATIRYADRHDIGDFAEARRRFVTAKRAHEHQPRY